MLFVLADPHLSFGSAKPMDIFTGWAGHARRLEQNWRRVVREGDTVVLPGDISWAMSLEAALPDFQFLHALPGNKILLKGNHDYWWNTRKKIEAFWCAHGLHSLCLLHNNAVLAEGVALCGSRGWFFDCEGEEEQKVLDREAGRLRTSIRAGKKLSDRLCVFLHYPPVTRERTCDEMMRVLRDEDVRCCYYGHLHGHSIKWAFRGNAEGIWFECVSADALAFEPKAVALERCRPAAQTLSLLLPFFNAETTLKDAVNAVLAQTRADWELLLIDDGATDGSVQIANTYAAQDPRIRVLRQKNGGVGAARNAGLLAAKGDYIGFLDADDTIDPTFVQTLLCAAATNQAEVVHAAYREITIKGETLLRSTTDVQGGPQWVSPKKMRALVCNIEDNHYFWSVCRCVFRVDFLRRLGLRFHEDMHYGEDTVFLLEACLEAARVWDIPDALYVYRKNAGSSTTTFWARPDALASFALQDKAKRALFAKYLSKEENEAAARRYSRYCLRVYLPLLLQGTRRRLGKCDYRAERAILASAPAQRALRTCKPKELLEKSADSWVCCLAKFHCYFLAHLILKYIWPR